MNGKNNEKRITSSAANSQLTTKFGESENFMIKANNPDLKSWVQVANDSDFPIQNLPFGIFNKHENYTAVGVAIGEFILDLSAME